MAGLTAGFNSCSFGAPSVTPKVTLLAALAPSLVTKSPQITPVQATNSGAAKAQQRIAAGACTDAKNLKASVAEVICTAKAQIAAACKAAGMEAAQVFPNTQMAGSAAEIGLDAVGGGSLATFQNSLQAIETASYVSADRAAGSSSEQIAEVAMALRMASTPSQGQIGLIHDADAPGQMAGTSINWISVLEAHGDEALIAIMNCDPDNPSPELFPELCEVNGAIALAENHMAAMQAVIDAAPEPIAAAAVDYKDLGVDYAGLFECQAVFNVLDGSDSAHAGIENGLLALVARAANLNREMPVVPVPAYQQNMPVPGMSFGHRAA